MSQWKNDDSAGNSVSWATTYVNLPANTANKTALFGNTTQGAWKNNNVAMQKAVGQFGMDVNEVKASNGSILAITITNPGSGYTANATVTVSSSPGVNATANATANSTGRISAINVSNTGAGYTTPAIASVAAPAAQSFNANTAVAANGFISITSNVLQNNDKVVYTVAAGNTKITELKSGSSYYVTGSNSTGVYLTDTPGGTPKTLTKGLSETGHSLRGETAQIVVTMTGIGSSFGAHAGWNLRTVGTGGRAGRVTYETLVAMGSMTGDASDDSILKDS